MKVLAFYAVWGETYINRFLSYGFATQLTPGNLFGLPEGSSVKIATRESDTDLFTNSEFVNLCRERIDVEIIAFPDKLFEKAAGDRYNIILRLQNYALGLAKNFDAIIFGYGDAMWSEGTYANAIERLAAGYDVVLCVGFNVIEDQVTALLDRRYGELPLEERAIPPRDFAKMVCDHIHPMTSSRYWNHPHMNNYPSFVLWPIEGAGVLARGFHLHPVIIRVQHDNPFFFDDFEVTIDEGLVPRLLRQGALPYISTSSDEMFVCGLAGEINESWMYHYPLRPPNPIDVGIFAEKSASIHHRLFFEHSLKIIYSGTGTEEPWRLAEEEASRLCSTVMNRLSIPDDILKTEIPAAFAARNQRRVASLPPRKSWRSFLKKRKKSEIIERVDLEKKRQERKLLEEAQKAQEEERSRQELEGQLQLLSENETVAERNRRSEERKEREERKKIVKLGTLEALEKKNAESSQISWEFIKTRDRAYVRALAVHYIDQAAPSVLSCIGMKSAWPNLRRKTVAVLRGFHAAERDVQISVPGEEAGPPPTMARVPMVSISLRQLIMIVIYLAWTRKPEVDA